MQLKRIDNVFHIDLVCGAVSIRGQHFNAQVEGIIVDVEKPAHHSLIVRGVGSYRASQCIWYLYPSYLCIISIPVKILQDSVVVVRESYLN